MMNMTWNEVELSENREELCGPIARRATSAHDGLSSKEN